MTVRQSVVYCDYQKDYDDYKDHCEITIEDCTVDRTVTAYRQSSARFGWTNIGNKDYCPWCIRYITLRELSGMSL